MMTITRFEETIHRPLLKKSITTLQINLGYKCNQTCHHCHISASPRRTEEISQDVIDDLIKIIRLFPQITTVDLTGGAPEMHYGFRDIVRATRDANKEIITRSNLTIFFEEGYQDLPDFFAEQDVHVVASLPCYLENNVDTMRGRGVYEKSISAIKILNEKGYGDIHVLDLVYSPSLPKLEKFSLAPDQKKLEQDYKKYLKEHFDITFNSLLTFTNLPIGRFQQHLENLNLDKSYLKYLYTNYNPSTIDHLMCLDQLSVDYLGNLYDCDFNQITGVMCSNGNGSSYTIKSILERNSLDIINEVQVRDYCFGCTAGSGSSCSGALL